MNDNTHLKENTMTEEPDIVERLRNYNTCSDTDVDEAADEIERLRKQRDAAMALVETIVHDVDVLSTRPATTIGLNDLVFRINEWGDAARKILN